MTPRQAKICRAIYNANASLTADEVALHVGGSRDSVIEELRQLDEDGQVTMRNGFYNVTVFYKTRVGVRA